MKLMNKVKPRKNETVVSWVIRELKANSMELSFYKFMKYSETHPEFSLVDNELKFNDESFVYNAGGDSSLLESCLELYTQMNGNPIANSLHSLLQLFYKQGKYPYQYEEDIYKTTRYCPICMQESLKNDGIPAFKVTNQLANKQYCEIHKTKLEELKHIYPLASNNPVFTQSSNSSKPPLEEDIRQSYLLEYIYEHKEELSYELLLNALIQENARKLQTKYFTPEYIQTLENIPEHSRINHLNNYTNIYLLDYFYKRNLQVGYELFLNLLTLTFNHSSDLHKTIVRIKNEGLRTEFELKLLLKYTVLEMKKRERIKKESQRFDTLNDYFFEDKKEEIIDENFRLRVELDSGGDYRVIKEFKYNTIEYAEIQHKFCQTTTIYRKEDFLKGRRCMNCEVDITEEMLEEMIDESFDGIYRYIKKSYLLSNAKGNNYIVYNQFNKKIYSLSLKEVKHVIRNKDKSIFDSKHELDKINKIYQIIEIITKRGY